MSEPIYRTVYQVEVFSQGPLSLSMRDDDPFGLLAINYEIDEGSCIGDVTEVSSDEVPPEDVEAHLVRIGNDGTFFDGFDDE